MHRHAGLLPLSLVAAGVLSCGGSVLSTPPAVEAPAPVPPPGVASAGDLPVAATRAAPPSARWHRGDWEPPDVLLVVYDEQWERALRKLIRRARRLTEVHVLWDPDDPLARAFSRWARARRVRTMHAAYDTPWIRDYGPLQVYEDGRPRWLDLPYSDERSLDDDIPKELASRFGVSLAEEAFSVDGGAIISNGHGLCLMTERNVRDAIDPRDRVARARLAERLGCRRLGVLQALPGEETGHADLIAQFFAPDVLAVGQADPARTPVLAAMLDDAVGRAQRIARRMRQRLRIVRVPLEFRQGVYYSYVNGTRVGDTFFVPDYATLPARTQHQAYAALSTAAPGLKLVPVEADAMAERGGAVHCLTLGLSTRRRERVSRFAMPGNVGMDVDEFAQ